MNQTETRIEKDSMGEMSVPAQALYGAQTQRAVLNFPISSLRMPRAMIFAFGHIKSAAAKVNMALGRLDQERGNAILKACDEVIAGQWDLHFPVDVFQTGSGTSTNMNVNEVVANRASEILGKDKGSKFVHPNDHVNLGQSSNDTFPTAMHIAATYEIGQKLVPAMQMLRLALDGKAKEFDKVIKIGRTHLADATPIRLGQVFSGYTAQINDCEQRVRKALDELKFVALGGTAVGTGINTTKSFSRSVLDHISKGTSYSFLETENHFAAQASKDALVSCSGALKTVAVALTKIGNDIRWLASGPRCGIGEIMLPDTQPGSSIMPGKVNPVIAESLLMVCAQVIGNDTTVTICGQAGNFELNVMMPVMIHNVLESIELLASSCKNFATRCVSGIEADEKRCNELVEWSLAMCTSLAPHIGYDQAAAIAKIAFKEGKTVRDVAREKSGLDDKKLSELLDPYQMTEPDSNG